MTKTLIDGVNEVLKKARIISGDTEELSSLTSSAIQGYVDTAVQAINEAIDELYSASREPMPKEQKEATITLISGDRGATGSYTLPTDMVQIRWPMIDKTNNQFLVEAPGGYNALLLNDTEQDDTGLPHYAAINPVDGTLFLDRAPTSVEAGRIYTFQYDRDLSLDDAADVFPFSDAVFRAMVPAWHQIWKREARNEFDTPIFNASIARASRFLTQKQMRDTYSPRG